MRTTGKSHGRYVLLALEIKNIGGADTLQERVRWEKLRDDSGVKDQSSRNT